MRRGSVDDSNEILIMTIEIWAAQTAGLKASSDGSLVGLGMSSGSNSTIAPTASPGNSQEPSFWVQAIRDGRSPNNEKTMNITASRGPSGCKRLSRSGGQSVGNTTMP